MESNKQEKKNLMNDNPIASQASGSWMSKYSVAAKSPFHMGGSAKGSPMHQMGTKKEIQERSDVMNKRTASVNKFGKKQEKINATIKSLEGMNIDKESNDNLNALSSSNFAQYKGAEKAYIKTKDSIVGLNKKAMKDFLINN